MNPSRFAILDRDGTIIHERRYLSDPAQVELLPNAAAGLRKLTSLGLGLVVITNQSGLGRGYFDESQLDSIHRRLAELLAAESVSLAGVYVCPHVPNDGCDCRKPRTALLIRAAESLHFNPNESFVIGDKACDVELGRRVGATTFLVRTGYGAALAASGYDGADHVVADIAEAAEIVAQLITMHPVPQL